MAQIPAVLAVDGGNSKADLALVAADGRVVAAIRVPGFSHQVVGLEGCAAALGAAVERLRELAEVPSGSPVARVGAFCLAGLDLPADDAALGSMLADAHLTQTTLLRNDVFAVLRAGTRGDAGVAVVCGAGMNGVGVAPDGRSVRYPALGEISGDWAAGGGWLGIRALGAAIRAEDGRGPSTELLDAVPACFGMRRPLEVTEAIYAGTMEPCDLRGLAPTVLACATSGDAVADGLVQEVADEVVTLVRATIVRLDLLDRDVPVVLGGGLFRSAERQLEARVVDGVGRCAPHAHVRAIDVPPVLGAALLGLDEFHGGVATPDEIESRLRGELAAAHLDRHGC